MAGGFASENTGMIKNSYSFAELTNLIGGFVAQDEGHTEQNCYFLHSEKEGSKKLDKLSDSAKAQRLAEIQNNESVTALGLDAEQIWRYLGFGNSNRFYP